MPRVGSPLIAQAFKDGRGHTIKNTTTNGTTVWLHRNAIAWKYNGTVEFSLCGWNTVTTRDRLNHIFNAFGLPIRVCQIKGDPYIYNYKTQAREEISSRLVYAASEFTQA